MLVLCKGMFIIIAAIQNNDKYWDTYLDQALGALLCLVCCDQGSIAHVPLGAFFGWVKYPSGLHKCFFSESFF